MFTVLRIRGIVSRNVFKQLRKTVSEIICTLTHILEGESSVGGHIDNEDMLSSITGEWDVLGPI